MTDTPIYVLFAVVFWNALAFGAGVYGERLLYRHRHRIARGVLQRSALPWRWREQIVGLLYRLYPLR